MRPWPIKSGLICAKYKTMAQPKTIVAPKSSAKTTLPKHVAFIMDGNRRWAKAHGLPTFEGHRAGFIAMRKIIRHAVKAGVKELSFYVFSTENWRRSKTEVSYLMDLFRGAFKRELAKLDKEDIRVRFAGFRSGVSADILQMIDKATSQTKHNDRAVVNFCFNYGGRADILAAAKRLIALKVEPDEVNEQTFGQSLSTVGMRDVDLVIRTSEHRLSGFLPWESVYAEILVLPDRFWPDFSEADFDMALNFFSSRQRRFGK